jgi:hypothetical protein
MSNPPLPKLGPWKLEDEFGAGAAVIMAKHSMDPGVTESTVQFETVRKMKSDFVNLYQASVDNVSTAVIGGREGGNQMVMGVPIYHGWYDRAKTGMHHLMGDKVVQDYGLSRKAVIALQETMEEEWFAARVEAGKRLDIAQLACFVCLGYARTLRGEEITKIELSGVRTYFADRAVEPRHVTLSLIGRFKQMEGGHQHFLPIAAETGSGLKIREWVGRLLDDKLRVGLTTDVMFLKSDGAPDKDVYF